MYTVATGVSPHLNNTPQHQDTILIGAIVPSGSTFTYQSIALTTDGFPDWFDNSTFALGHSGSHISLIGRSFLHATYRPDPEVGGRIWTCHHIQASTGGTNPEPVYGNFVRYYEIHTNGWPNSSGTPKVMYYGDILLEGGETYDPSIAVNAEGHIGLTWTQSSENMWPEFWMGVQRSFDTPGTLGYSRKIEDSSAVRTQQKADYSGIDPDPEDPCLFWGHSPLGQSTTKWESFVGALCVPDCDADSYADQDANQVYDALRCCSSPSASALATRAPTATATEPSTCLTTSASTASSAPAGGGSGPMTPTGEPSITRPIGSFSPSMLLVRRFGDRRLSSSFEIQQPALAPLLAAVSAQ